MAGGMVTFGSCRCLSDYLRIFLREFVVNLIVWGRADPAGRGFANRGLGVYYNEQVGHFIRQEVGHAGAKVEGVP